MAVAVAQMFSLHSLRVALMAELFTKLVNVFASNCKPVFIRDKVAAYSFRTEECVVM